MNVYFISGLGADERIFQRIRLPERFTMIHIRYPELSTGETLVSYCRKIAGQIDTRQPFSLVGVSFGGIIANELTRIVHPEKVIILSSVSVRKEMPLFYRLSGSLRLLSLVPNAAFNKANPLVYWLFGTVDLQQTDMLGRIITETSPIFMKWALKEIVNWKQDERIPAMLHIHGSDDKLFPVKNTAADHVIYGAGHLMVYTHAVQVNKLIADILIEPTSND